MGACCLRRDSIDKRFNEDIQAQNLMLDLEILKNQKTEESYEVSDTERITSSTFQSSMLPHMVQSSDIKFKTMQTINSKKKLTNSLSIEKQALFEFHIAIVGDKEVGKTNIYQIIKAQETTKEYIPTSKPQTTRKIIRKKSQKYLFQFTEYPSKLIYPDFASTDWENIGGVLLLFALNSQDSFKAAQNFVVQNELELTNKVVFFIASKSDLQREVQQSEAIQFASQHQLKYFEVSTLNLAEVNNIVKAFVKFFF